MPKTKFSKLHRDLDQLGEFNKRTIFTWAAYQQAILTKIVCTFDKKMSTDHCSNFFFVKEISDGILFLKSEHKYKMKIIYSPAS